MSLLFSPAALPGDAASENLFFAVAVPPVLDMPGNTLPHFVSLKGTPGRAVASAGVAGRTVTVAGGGRTRTVRGGGRT